MCSLQVAKEGWTKDTHRWMAPLNILVRYSIPKNELNGTIQLMHLNWLYTEGLLINREPVHDTNCFYSVYYILTFMASSSHKSDQLPDREVSIRPMSDNVPDISSILASMKSEDWLQNKKEKFSSKHWWYYYIYNENLQWPLLDHTDCKQ